MGSAILDFADGRASRADWSAEPWRSARPALKWLRPSDVEGADGDGGGSLDPGDALGLSQRMVARLRPNPCLAWSSRMLDEAALAIAFGVGGPPEPFYRAVFDAAADWELSRLEWEFARAVRVPALRWRGDPGWDLRWFADRRSDAQAAVVHWLAAVAPGSLSEPEIGGLELRFARFLS